MIDDTIYGYGVSLNHVFDDLNTSKSKISDLDVKLLANLIDHPSQLKNAIDNANNSLFDKGQPLVKLAIQNDYLDTPAFIYYQSVMPYSKTYDKQVLTSNIKSVIADIIWSEYSAPFENRNYPIKEDDFIKQTIANIPDSKIMDLDLDLDIYR